VTFKEKYLYHQIHPLKLMVDFSTGFTTTYLAWQHNTTLFLVLFLLPSVIITLLLFKYADLERFKNSPLGTYIKKHMTSTIELIRFAGQIIMWIAGWLHLPVLIAIGFFVIAGAWCNGLFVKVK
jgi:hypothetical protein